MTKETNHILLYGIGAIGGFYTFVLDNSGEAHVSVVGRSNFQAIKENGLTLKSVIFGDKIVKPFGVFPNTQEASVNKYKYVVCCNKALEPEKLPDQLKDVITPSYTTVVLIQNGVGAEEPLRAAFPDNGIITCVTWVGATQVAPGQIHHVNRNSITLGGYDSATTESDVEEFSQLLQKGGSEVEVSKEMQVKRWEKVIWNIAWNSLTTLTMLNTEQFLVHSSEYAIPLSRKLMHEAVTVARACNVNIDYSVIDALMDKTLGTKGGMESSMMNDLRNNRPMEVEVILGYPMRKAKEHNIPTPILDTLYVLMAAQNYRVKNVRL
jgi:2-dehydropantoate 2-reductase